MKWLKENLYLIVGALLFSIILGILINASIDGYYLMVTQERIDDSYRIHR